MLTIIGNSVAKPYDCLLQSSGLKGMTGSSDMLDVDAVVLTAGVGENVVGFGELLFATKPLGIELSSELNSNPNDGPRFISGANSSIPLLVIPTNEELEIARQSVSGSKNR